MKIVITMPAWNQLQYTKWAVESMLRHGYPHDISYCFVDNGSTDGTYEYLASKRPAMLIRNDRNLGVSRAWNQGLKASLELKPDIVCLQSNDVWVGQKWLDPVVRELSKPEKRYFLPNGDFSSHETFESDVERLLPTLSGTKVGRAGWCLFFTAEAIRMFMPLPDDLFLWYSDDFIHLKLGKAGYQCFVLQDCCVFHFGSKTVLQTPDYQQIVAKDRETFARISDELMKT